MRIPQTPSRRRPSPKEMATALPLHGVRVVDFGTFIAGPLVSRLLSDAGADVVRVLPPGKQESPAYCDPGEVLNRNKQIMLLDLKTADGAAAAWELLADADVIVENFRPSVMERLGFGRAAVHPAFLGLPDVQGTFVQWHLDRVWRRGLPQGLHGGFYVRR